MKQRYKNRKIIRLLLLFLAIILISVGCGKTGAAPTDYTNYVADNNSLTNNENEIINDTSITEPDPENIENNNQSENYSPPEIINSLTLSWSEPSFNADGSPLSGDLTGYIIYYGSDSGNYTESVDIGNIRSASVSDLMSGTWCFAVTAYDSVGNESDLSEEICKTIS